MGNIVSRFRKKKTTIEILENLDKNIKEIEKYGLFTEQRHKKIVGTLVAYSVILYIIAALTCYFYFFPTSPYDQLIYVTPLLIFPILIIFVKKLVSWYYKRKLRRNEEKLSSMQKDKKKILDEVTETETYRKAKEILLKFAPDQLRMSPLSPQPNYSITSSSAETPRRTNTPLTSGPVLPSGVSELRRRALTSNAAQTGRLSNIGPYTTAIGSPLASPLASSSYQPIRANNAPTTGPTGTPLPRPILPQQRSYLDKLVEYLVGDGPSNRYALICRQCESHNGMALKEEFEYFGFKCCYCNFWNPARKQKPSAPKLDWDYNPLSSSSITSLTMANLGTNLQAPKSSDNDGSSSPSETDSDIEVVEKPVETPESETFEEEEEEEEAGEKDTGESPIGNEEERIEQVREESQSEVMEVDQSPLK
ncbi:endoplasmic reticulum junction formation protein lunapark-B isoform X2 [Leptopilina heterotoma]|uniref:endoplasmic reticulum junction formation protein lunapark-B isoform X2 n=1 Tax=Leptopilina heterotoma TaxID=63436 RepID=UPI001CA7CE59|nr:endoplasmic reticulum junction formation protein lunapark-B isoform X2 [Leptopilina heterotoma]